MTNLFKMRLQKSFVLTPGSCVWHVVERVNRQTFVHNIHTRLINSNGYGMQIFQVLIVNYHKKSMITIKSFATVMLKYEIFMLLKAD